MARKGQWGPKRERHGGRSAGSKSINKRRKESHLIDRRFTRKAEGKSVGPAHSYQKKAGANKSLRKIYGWP